MNYYIQGDAANADKIKAAFEKKGYSDKGFTFDVNDILFFTANNKHINVCPANGWLADIIKTHPDYKELELPVKPKFKVGDEIAWIEAKGSKPTEPVKIIKLIDKDQLYMVDMSNGVSYVAYDMQDYYKLVPKPHYDIKNFKPFDKVLVRDDDNECWMPSLFGWVDSGLQDGKFVCGTSDWYQCIPYEGNEHLLGTTDMCDEQYINW